MDFPVDIYLIKKCIPSFVLQRYDLTELDWPFSYKITHHKTKISEQKNWRLLDLCIVSDKFLDVSKMIA